MIVLVWLTDDKDYPGHFLQAARDPFLAHNPVDEMYYLIGNNQSLIRDKLTYDQAFNQGYKGIVVWEAKNDLLTSWSQPRLLDVAQNDSLHVFAPEAVWLPDRQLFLVSMVTIVRVR